MIFCYFKFFCVFWFICNFNKFYFSDTLDSILTSTKLDELNDDSILNSNSSLNAERPVHRRKRRISTTRTSLSETDSMEDNSSNQEEKLQDLNETLEQISLNENTEKTNDSNDANIPPGRLRTRSKRDKEIFI